MAGGISIPIFLCMSKKLTTVSVIIAVYNEEKRIGTCIRSIFEQSRPPDEAIVIDDGSTDRTWDELKLLHKNYPRLTLCKIKHREQAAARNYGFKKSRGDILVFPDADYYFDRKFLENLVLPIIKGQVIATYTNEEYVANPKNIWSRCWNIHAGLPFGRRVPLNNPQRSNNFRAIRRREFIQAGGFSKTGYSNDITVLNKLGVKDAGVAVWGAVCYHYNPDSLAKVFASAYRKGSKGGIQPAVMSFLIYSPPNSLRKGIISAIVYGMPAYVIFKIIFDIGVLAGLIQRKYRLLLHDPQAFELGAPV